jgi:hypothetical protein
MSRKLFFTITLFMLALLPLQSALAAPALVPSFNTLVPGGFTNINQDLTVNIVFIGYEPGSGPQDINGAAFVSELPEMYRTVNRYPSFYFGNEYMGVDFNYDFNLVFSDTAFEDAFFGHLSSVAQPAPLTVYQSLYNLQANRSVDITDNHVIEVSAVESWLAANAEPMLNVDTQQYTVFFINWYGRPDFKFHVYQKTDEPDPDTGTNFGQFQSRKVIAWGGSTPDDPQTGLGALHRIWFYDLSAGPEAWTDNWNVDNADLDGNGVMDYRMPPVWEYGNLSAYRPFDNLSGDLGKVTRYVALNLLFTTSPLYKPFLSPPLLPESVQLDINVFQMDPNSDGTHYFDVDLINKNLGDLQPLKTYSTELNSQPFDARFQQVYECFYFNESCFGNRLFGIAFGDLFLYFQDTLLQYLEGDADYEVPVFAFNATDELFTCCLGFADDNWADGTQSFVFAFDAPFIRDFGYGFTTTTIHEVGHHIGMSHPHDGFDYEANVDYGPGDNFYYAWSGDESNTMMSYIDLNWDFSQFDRDNMNRYLVSGYLNQANVILAKIMANPRAGNVSALLTSADEKATLALVEYQAMEYSSAAANAKAAYQDVLEAAARIRVQIEPQSYQADYKAKGASPKFVDEVDYNRHRFEK